MAVCTLDQHLKIELQDEEEENIEAIEVCEIKSADDLEVSTISTLAHASTSDSTLASYRAVHLRYISKVPNTLNPA